jgi:hypothetical protein
VNLFVLDEDPRQAAMYHCDRRVAKMLIETAQQLSTALRCCGVDDDRLMKSTHVNSGTTKWVRECRGNWDWTYELYVGLVYEFRHRREKEHLSSRLMHVFPEHRLAIPSGPRDEFQKSCRNDTHNLDFTHVPNPVCGYRQYLAARWMLTDVAKPSFTNREAPAWAPGAWVLAFKHLTAINHRLLSAQNRKSA